MNKGVGGEMPTGLNPIEQPDTVDSPALSAVGTTADIDQMPRGYHNILSSAVLRPKLEEFLAWQEYDRQNAIRKDTEAAWDQHEATGLAGTGRVIGQVHRASESDQPKQSDNNLMADRATKPLSKKAAADLQNELDRLGDNEWIGQQLVRYWADSDNVTFLVLESALAARRKVVTEMLAVDAAIKARTFGLQQTARALWKTLEQLTTDTLPTQTAYTQMLESAQTASLAVIDTVDISQAAKRARLNRLAKKVQWWQAAYEIMLAAQPPVNSPPQASESTSVLTILPLTDQLIEARAAALDAAKATLQNALADFRTGPEIGIHFLRVPPIVLEAADRLEQLLPIEQRTHFRARLEEELAAIEIDASIRNPQGADLRPAHEPAARTDNAEAEPVTLPEGELLERLIDIRLRKALIFVSRIGPNSSEYIGLKEKAEALIANSGWTQSQQELALELVRSVPTPKERRRYRVGVCIGKLKLTVGRSDKDMVK